jgi:hypothetical protein
MLPRYSFNKIAPKLLSDNATHHQRHAVRKKEKEKKTQCPDHRLHLLLHVNIFQLHPYVHMITFTNISEVLGQ